MYKRTVNSLFRGLGIMVLSVFLVSCTGAEKEQNAEPVIQPAERNEMPPPYPPRLPPPIPSGPTETAPSEDTSGEKQAAAPAQPVTKDVEFQVMLEGLEEPLFLAPGGSGTVGTGSFRLTVQFPMPLPDEHALKAVTVEGSLFQVTGWHASTRSLGLRVAAGKNADIIKVSVRLGDRTQVLQLTRVPEATVVLERQVGETMQWQPVSPWEVAPAGSTTLRLRFSKPVDTEAVARVLQTSQVEPVRGFITWPDKKTMIWQIPTLPSRLFFLLGGATDVDGLPLPGGLPVIRVGKPPTLQLYEATARQENEVAVVPPDALSAQVLEGGRQVLVAAWVPGRTQWDWSRDNFLVDVASGAITRGGPPENPLHSRIPQDLTAVSVAPGGVLAAGYRGTELVLVDLRSGREKKYDAKLPQGRRSVPAWSSDAKRLVVLHANRVAVLEAGTWHALRIVENLPVEQGARLTWSSDERYVLVGSVVVDLTKKTFVRMPGDPNSAHGRWEPDGDRLSYTGADWSDIWLYSASTGERLGLGSGLLVGWVDKDRLMIVRWPAAHLRYQPPGQQ